MRGLQEDDHNEEAQHTMINFKSEGKQLHATGLQGIEVLEGGGVSTFQAHPLRKVLLCFVPLVVSFAVPRFALQCVVFGV